MKTNNDSYVMRKQINPFLDTIISFNLLSVTKAERFHSAE